MARREIQSFREVLRKWKKKYPKKSVRKIREELACIFVYVVASAHDHHTRFGPVPEEDIFDYEKLLDEAGIFDSECRAKLLSGMKKLDDHMHKHKARTAEEKSFHKEVLVSLISVIPSMTEVTARAFVEAFFYHATPVTPEVLGWFKFHHVSMYWVFTGKYLAPLRREHKGAL